MKKINKKGFTLIELLAVIIIMGVLLLVAVPSVSKYIEQSRKDTYVTNLVKYADVVKTEVNSYAEGYTFKSDEYLVVPITCLELESGSTTKSPFSEYVPERSYIVVTRKADNSGFEYEVAAVDKSNFGTTLSPALEEEIKITSISDGVITKIKEENDELIMENELKEGLTAVIPKSCAEKVYPATGE